MEDYVFSPEFAPGNIYTHTRLLKGETLIATLHDYSESRGARNRILPDYGFKSSVNRRRQQFDVDTAPGMEMEVAHVFMDDPSGIFVDYQNRSYRLDALVYGDRAAETVRAMKKIFGQSIWKQLQVVQLGDLYFVSTYRDLVKKQKRETIPGISAFPVDMRSDSIDVSIPQGTPPEVIPEMLHNSISKFVNNAKQQDYFTFITVKIRDQQAIQHLTLEDNDVMYIQRDQDTFIAMVVREDMVLPSLSETTSIADVRQFIDGSPRENNRLRDRIFMLRFALDVIGLFESGNIREADAMIGTPYGQIVAATTELADLLLRRNPPPNEFDPAVLDYFRGFLDWRLTGVIKDLSVFQKTLGLVTSRTLKAELLPNMESASGAKRSRVKAMLLYQ